MALGISAGLAWKEIFEHISEDELNEIKSYSQHNFALALIDKLARVNYSTDEAVDLLTRACILEQES